MSYYYSWELRNSKHYSTFFSAYFPGSYGWLHRKWYFQLLVTQSQPLTKQAIKGSTKTKKMSQVSQNYKSSPEGWNLWKERQRNSWLVKGEPPHANFLYINSHQGLKIQRYLLKQRSPSDVIPLEIVRDAWVLRSCDWSAIVTSLGAPTSHWNEATSRIFTPWMVADDDRFILRAFTNKTQFLKPSFIVDYIGYKRKTQQIIRVNFTVEWTWSIVSLTETYPVKIRRTQERTWISENKIEEIRFFNF